MDGTKERAEALAHIARVRELAGFFCSALDESVKSHDASKLESPEFEEFMERTAQLKGMTYGSPEYKKQLDEMKPVLTHHYQNNRHHPEHFEDGVAGMTLVDLVEMFCDWLAAVERHSDGDIFKSIEYNTGRFGLSAQLASVLGNTAERVFGRSQERKG